MHVGVDEAWQDCGCTEIHDPAGILRAIELVAWDDSRDSPVGDQKHRRPAQFAGDRIEPAGAANVHVPLLGPRRRNAHRGDDQHNQENRAPGLRTHFHYVHWTENLTERVVRRLSSSEASMVSRYAPG